MRKLVLSITIIALALQLAVCQTSVKEAREEAEKLAKKVNNRRLKRFQKAYTEALEDIKKTEEASTTNEFGYDAVADNANSWYKLHEYIKNKFNDGPITYKKESVTLFYKDYSNTEKEARLKAAKAHFDAGEKILTNSSDYNTRLKALNHFELTNKYSNREGEKANTSYDKINRYCAKIYYDEGVKILNTNTMDLDQLKTAKKLLSYVEKYDKDYQDWQAKYDAACLAGAEVCYKNALELAKEASFEKQRSAYSAFQNVLRWKNEYKDAEEKMNIAYGRAYPQIIFVEASKEILEGNDLRGSVDNKRVDQDIPSYYKINTGEDFKNLNMWQPESWEKAKTGKYNFGFIVVRMSDKYGETKYTTDTPEASTETVGNYYITKKDDTGKWQKEDKVSKSRYESAKKTYDAALSILSDSEKEGFLKTGEMKFRKEEGTVTTHRKKAIASYEVYMEIWDCRGEGAPQKITTITDEQKVIDQIYWEVYSGSDAAKPSNLRQKNSALKTEEELTKNIGIGAPPLKHFVAVNMAVVAKAIQVPFK
ncbi:MAG: hypothetical protein PHD00_07990 [Bacteroidales bacterium]|nr:hypothetical protein [Bacteroidales bacterium]